MMNNKNFKLEQKWAKKIRRLEYNKMIILQIKFDQQLKNLKNFTHSF